MSLTLRVAARFQASADLEEALDLLDDLKELDRNLSDVEDTFELHYAAAMNPEVVSQIEALNKAREGLAKAQEAVKALKRITELFAEDKTAVRGLVEAERMVDKFTKHVQTSRDMVRKLSKKELPENLKKLSKQVESAIEARLIDPSKLEVFAWQASDENWTTKVRGVQFQMRFRVVLNRPANENEGMAARDDIIDLVLAESTADEKAQVMMTITLNGANPHYNLKPASKNEAVDLFLNAVKGWSNIKGESESQQQRKPTAESIGRALGGVARNYSDSDKVTISSDSRTVELAVRDESLPKEGESAVGEHRYSEMVRDAISRLRKRVDTAVAPWSKNIGKIDIHDGEKSWLYVTVELK